MEFFTLIKHNQISTFIRQNTIFKFIIITICTLVKFIISPKNKYSSDDNSLVRLRNVDN